MQRTIIIILIIVLIIGFTYSYIQKVTNDIKNAPAERFVVTYQQGENVTRYLIVLDTETGIEYLYIQSGYGGGITVLEKGE